MRANLNSVFVKKLKNGNYFCTPWNIQAVSNGPDAYTVCHAVALNYAYQLSPSLGKMPTVDVVHGAVRVHARVTVNDTGIVFENSDNRGGWRRRAWRSKARQIMSQTPPSMSAYTPSSAFRKGA